MYKETVDISYYAFSSRSNNVKSRIIPGAGLLDYE